MPSAKNQHGKLALSLVDENGHNLPEYRVEATGRDIVVIKPDQPFRVKVGIYARPTRQKNKSFIAHVYVDGKRISYGEGQYLSNRVSFFPYRGFLEASTKVATADMGTDATRTSSVGKVEVEFFDTKFSHREKNKEKAHDSDDEDEEDKDGTGDGGAGGTGDGGHGGDPGEDWPEDDADEVAEHEGLSEYELQRLRTIKSNHRRLSQLGL